MLKRLMRVALERFLANKGYKLVANNFIDWPNHDQEFMEIFERQVRFGWDNADGPKAQRMYMIRNFLLTIKELHGDWAECGVFKGSTSLMMAEYAQRYELLHPGCKVHLFDSFQGLSSPAEADSGTNMIEGDFLGTELEVRENLKLYDCFVFQSGWIPDRFNDVENRKFSFVHIDVDFYEPVRDSLEFFLPRMVNGGIIVLDDFGCDETPGARRATEEVLSRYDYRLCGLPFGQAFVVAQNTVA
jgi:O-methyltransferase